MVISIGDKQYALGQNKINNDIKTIYLYNGCNWEKIFTGTKEERTKYIKHLKQLANKKEYRQLIKDITGTSYDAACKDMGIGRI